MAIASVPSFGVPRYHFCFIFDLILANAIQHQISAKSNDVESEYIKRNPRSGPMSIWMDLLRLACSCGSAVKCGHKKMFSHFSKTLCLPISLHFIRCLVSNDRWFGLRTRHKRVCRAIRFIFVFISHLRFIFCFGISAVFHCAARNGWWSCSHQICALI